MKQIRLYPLKVLAAFLLVFLILGTQILFFTEYSALHQKTFETILETQQLEEKTYRAMETWFTSRSNSTGIPASVFLDAIDQEDLHQGMRSGVSDAFSYLDGQTDTYQFRMDFSALEQSVTDFFETYAEENHYQKDDVYFQKKDATIQEAEAEIISIADVFRFSLLYENGWLAKARNYRLLLHRGCLFAAIALGVMLLLLVACCAGQLHETLYWLGISGLTAGLLVAVPCLCLQASDYISGFIIKDEQIFTAVVGYLELLLHRAITGGVCTAAAGVLLLLLFAVVHARKQSEA